MFYLTIFYIKFVMYSCNIQVVSQSRFTEKRKEKRKTNTD